MKSQTLPTKRKPVSKGVFRKLSAVTSGRRRKQRAATTANARDFDDGQASARIGRALFVILLIHVIAIAMILIHHNFLSDRPIEESAATQENVQDVVPVKPASQGASDSGVVRSQMAPNEKPYIVGQGETYASIAATLDVSERDLRAMNDKVKTPRPGHLLKIPVKRVVIKAPRPDAATPVTVQVRQPVEQPAPRPAVPVRDQGLVEAIDTRNAPRATPVTAASGDKYVVKKGDTVWGIAHRHGVDQKKLMEANGISDPRKLRLGMTLRIP